MAIIERHRYGSRGQGRLIKYADSVRYISCYYVNGKEHRESTGHTELKKAKAWHKRKLDEIASQRQGHAPVVTPAMKAVTVNELLDELFGSPEFKSLKSADTCKYHAVAVREHFGTWRAVNVTSEAWDRYIEKRQQDVEDSTINREGAVLRAMFKLAVQRKRLNLMQVPKLSRLPERNVRRVFFDRDEFEALVAHLPEWLQDAVRFDYLCGWRKGDVKSLKWADVDTQAMTITLPTSKNGEGRTLALPDELIEILKRREQARLITTPSGDVRVVDYVFHRAGRALGDFRKVWKAACIKAGLFHIEKAEDGTEIKKHDRNFHDFRRSAVRNLRRAGVDETVAMTITGHRTASVFRRYNIVDERDIRQAMKATSEYVASLPTKREEQG